MNDVFGSWNYTWSWWVRAWRYEGAGFERDRLFFGPKARDRAERWVSG